MHSGGLEATIGAFDGLITGNTMLHRGLHGSDRTATIVGPLVSGSRDCIRIWGAGWGTFPLNGRYPQEGLSSIDELWMHLVSAGVTPTS